jgi:transcriptional regulator with XRE-family HTH domain
MSRQRKEIDTSTYSGRFAERLRMLREKKGLSVDQLAEKSGISRTTLYNWESTISQPLIEQLPALADALGVKIGKLFPEK